MARQRGDLKLKLTLDAIEEDFEQYKIIEHRNKTMAKAAEVAAARIAARLKAEEEAKERRRQEDTRALADGLAALHQAFADAN